MVGSARTWMNPFDSCFLIAQDNELATTLRPGILEVWHSTQEVQPSSVFTPQVSSRIQMLCCVSLPTIRNDGTSEKTECWGDSAGHFNIWANALYSSPLLSERLGTLPLYLFFLTLKLVKYREYSVRCILYLLRYRCPVGRCASMHLALLAFNSEIFDIILMRSVLCISLKRQETLYITSSEGPIEQRQLRRFVQPSTSCLCVSNCPKTICLRSAGATASASVN